jgi:PmbA protein
MTNLFADSDIPDLATRLLAEAKKAGADAAEVVVAESQALTLGMRLGTLEKLERAESREVGVRVFVDHATGRKVASVSTSRLQPQDLPDLANRAVAMARVSPPDAYAGLADAALLAKSWPELDLFDPMEVSAQDLRQQVEAMEQAALQHKGVCNTENAAADWHAGRSFFATTNGFVGGYQATTSALSITAIAQAKDGSMEQDYEYALARFRSDLPLAEQLGNRAGQHAVKRLNPHKLNTATMPVIFAPRVARDLIGQILSAISGSSITRRASFLLDKLGQQVASSAITLQEDPHRLRGLRSRPFDAEGLATVARPLITAGVLQSYLLDLASARQLSMTPTGHAARAMAGTPGASASNVWIEGGSQSPDQLMADISYGFYVTDLMGMGVNLITGDYSQGASGYLIGNGRITDPISEVTIAGKLQDMLATATPANDLVFAYGVDAPTIRVDHMMVAGK